jgi:hypothetical protein
MFSDRAVEHIQNISLFTIGCVSLYAYVITDGKKVFEQLLPFVGIHALLDIFVVKSRDLQFHHVCTIMILFYNYYCGVHIEIGYHLIAPLIKTEISSIFLCLKCWLPKSGMVSAINLLVFYGFFVKYRIVDFYVDVIGSSSFLSIIEHYSPRNYLLSGVLVLPIYGLSMLNVYWLLVMTKMLYKRVSRYFPYINTDAMCHYMCSYVHFINVPLSVYLYSQNPGERYMFDVIGIYLLSITSYIYHTSSYVLLQSEGVESYDYTPKETITHFLNDVLCTHVRSYLSVITSYYYSNYLWSVAIVLGINHSVSIYRDILNIFGLLINYEDEKAHFMKKHNVITIFPIAVDLGMICLNSAHNTAIPLFWVSVSISLLFFVVPFYKQTHFVFHILLIVQNYYLCKSHSQK